MKSKQEIENLRACFLTAWANTGRPKLEFKMLGVLEWILSDSTGDLHSILNIAEQCGKNVMQSDPTAVKHYHQHFRQDTKCVPFTPAQPSAETETVAPQPADTVQVSRADLQALRAHWMNKMGWAFANNEPGAGAACNTAITMCDWLLGDWSKAETLVDKAIASGRELIQKEPAMVDEALKVFRTTSSEILQGLGV